MNEKDYKIIENMEKYGGGFVKALAVCFQKADSHNFVKLRITFNNYWKEYKSYESKD